MPVFASNATSVGRFDSSFSSTSIYCGQFETTSVLSVAELSSLTQLASVCCAPFVPQAARALPVRARLPAANAPRIRVRREREERVNESNAAASGDSGGRERLRI